MRRQILLACCVVSALVGTVTAFEAGDLVILTNKRDQEAVLLQKKGGETSWQVRLLNCCEKKIQVGLEENMKAKTGKWMLRSQGEFCEGDKVMFYNKKERKMTEGVLHNKMLSSWWLYYNGNSYQCTEDELTKVDEWTPPIPPHQVSAAPDLLNLCEASEVESYNSRSSSTRSGYECSGSESSSESSEQRKGSQDRLVNEHHRASSSFWKEQYQQYEVTLDPEWTITWVPADKQGNGVIVTSATASTAVGIGDHILKVKGVNAESKNEEEYDIKNVEDFVKCLDSLEMPVTVTFYGDVWGEECNQSPSFKGMI